MDHADTPPADAIVLGEVTRQPHGIAVGSLIEALEAQGYDSDNVIRAILRVLDRGLAELGDGATIVATREDVPVAA